MNLKCLLSIMAIMLCSTACFTRTVVKEKIKFVDMQTYRDWGTTKLVPIHRRPLPTETQVCNNPMWADSYKCKEKNRVYKRTRSYP